MSRAKVGDTVRVHYTGRLSDGTVFDTSLQRDPLEFTIGAGQLIPGFEQAVVGMEAGESRTAEIPVEQAYGEHREDMVVTVERERFPDHIEPEVGLQLQLQQPGGMPLLVTVTEVADADITLDANHPLAGQDLTFDIELVGIS